MFYCGTAPEVFLIKLSRLSNGIDPLQILRLAENDAPGGIGIKKGFTDEYLRADFEEQKLLLRTLTYLKMKKILQLALEKLNLDIAISYKSNAPDRTSILILGDGLSSVIIPNDMMRERLKKMIINALSDENVEKIVLPVFLREYCISRLEHWINNAFVAMEMKYGREYIIGNDAIYPVDYKSTGVIEVNKKWGDGLQQFLEMKHGFNQSPLSPSISH